MTTPMASSGSAPAPRQRGQRARSEVPPQAEIMEVATVNDVSYEQLAKLPLVRCYERAFRKATGVDLSLVPTGPPFGRLSHGTCQNVFCRLVARVPGLGRACRAGCERGDQPFICEPLTAQTLSCPAGLAVVAVPVIVGGRHAAVWVGGRVFCRKPKRADFKRVAKQLAEEGVTDGLQQIEAAFFGTPVVLADQLLAMRQLLTLFAQHLEQHLDGTADRLWAVCKRGEPWFVTRAKQFVREHVAELIDLRQVAAAVHTDPSYFHQVFRDATGLAFTGYVSRLRVERAKTLLADPSLRVAQVAYAAGFTSIPQFSTLFRKWVGQSPAKYRALLWRLNTERVSPKKKWFSAS